MLHANSRRLLRLAFVLLALVAAPRQAAASHCGGLDEPACTVADFFHSGFVGCQSGLTEVPFPGGTCIQLDGQGFPPFCGGANERPCRLNEHIPSCKSGLVEHFGLDRCIQIDADGFPSICGGAGERPCTVAEHIPSCKTGLVEDFEANRCGAVDPDGFPDFCGGINERPCRVIEHIPSCRPDLIEHLPTDRCIQLDADGFPAFCGGELERACSLVEHVPSCKPGLQEKPRIVNGSPVSICEGPPPDCGREGQRACTLIEHIPSCQPGLQEKPETVDGAFVSICKGPPPACGRNGQRACTVIEHIPSCQPGLSELFLEFNVCGTAPVDWGESDADEPARGSRRSVFVIHDAFTDLAASAVPQFVERLRDRAPNLGPIYAVDWNNGGDAARHLMTFTECQGTPNCVRSWGPEPFDSRTFTFTQVAYALAQAIEELPTETDITLIGHGVGGLLARQVVYRHHDEMRKAGKRIAEVVTIGAPHGGLLAAGVDTHIGLGADLQTDAACAKQDGEEADHTACEVGTWLAWALYGTVGGIDIGGGRFIDDRDYPQVRWVNVAANGGRLDVGPTLERARAGGEDTAELVGFLENLAVEEPYHDSDGVVTTRSALHHTFDECYPFSREVNPNGIHPAVRHTLRLYETSAGNHLAFSAHCLNPDARVDPRVDESTDPAGFPAALDFVPHSGLLSSPHVQNFVLSALHVFGDTNGDGAVTADDLSADAGPDQTFECAGALTPVQLDGSASVVTGDGAVFTWSGPFGIATGLAPVLELARGTHTLLLTVEQSGFQSTDEVVITISDTTPPTLTVPAGFTTEATDVTATPFAFAAGAADSCGGVIVQRSPELSAYPFGATEVLVTATDDAGNSTSATVTVMVVDTTPPVLSVPAPVVAEANAVLSTVDIGMATATDIFPVTVGNNAPGVFPLGPTVVTWTATDANGNTAQGTQDVMVVDATPPALTIPPDVTVIASGPLLTNVEIGSASATDIFGATVFHDAPAGFPIGTTDVTWTAVDGNGNRSSATQRIHVVYEFNGFEGPIEPDGTYKANRTLPLQFRLSFADGTPSTAAVAMLSVELIGADMSALTPLDVSADAPADEGVRFRFTGNHYQFNLNTQGWPAGSYLITVGLDDGRTHAMEIVLR